MFGSSKLTKTVAGFVVGAAGLFAVSGGASAAALTIEDVGFVATGATGTKIQRVDLAAAGLTTINTVVLTDLSLEQLPSQFGDPGIFSGYDIDAIVLDKDGNVNTTGDQVHFTSVSLTAGAIRPTANTNQQASAPNNIGSPFGTDNGGNIGDFGPANSKNATLSIFDGINLADRFNANGYLTLGDGGVLTVTFADILVSEYGWLIFGEVGGQGEAVRVEVPGQVPLPGAVWLFLSAIALLFGMSRRRNTATA